jgi:hypothetical protein
VLTPSRSNCLEGASVYWEWAHWDDPEHGQHLNRRWRATVQHHVGFKWLWLNALAPDAPEVRMGLPAGAPRVTVEVVEDVVFADERFEWEQRAKHGAHRPQGH